MSRHPSGAQPQPFFGEASTANVAQRSAAAAVLWRGEHRQRGPAERSRSRSWRGEHRQRGPAGRSGAQRTTRPRRTIRDGSSRAPRSRAGIAVVDDQVGQAALDQAREAEPFPGSPGAGRAARPRAPSRPARAAAASPGPPCRARSRRRRRSRRRSARRPRTRRAPRPGSRPAARACASAYRGNFSSALFGDAFKRLYVHHRRHQSGPSPSHLVDQVQRQPGTVLDRVHPGPDQRSRPPPRRRCARPPGRRPRVPPRSRPRPCPASQRRGQVAGRPVDPVADQLHPAVAQLGLIGHGRRQVRVGHLHADVAQVAADRRDMPARAGQSRQVGLTVQLGVRVRRARVADRQHARVPVGTGQLPGVVELPDRRPTRRDADVAVRVDQPRQHVPRPGQRLRTGYGLVGDPVADQPQVPYLVVGQDHASHMQRHAKTIRRRDAAPPVRMSYRTTSLQDITVSTGHHG